MLRQAPGHAAGNRPGNRQPQAGVLLLVAVLTLLLIALLGIAQRHGVAPAAAGPVPVRLLMPAPFVDATAPLLKTFHRSHPNLRLEVTRGPLDTEAMSDLAIGALLLGETPYDVMLVDVTWTARYAAAGWLTPLEPLLGNDALEGMVPGARLGNHFDGHLWRMPFNGDTGLLYWRTDLMDKPPADTAELEEIAGRLQREGLVRWGYVWQGRQYEGLSCVMLEVLNGFGAYWWRPSAEGVAPVAGQTDLASPGAIRAAAWLQGLIRQGITPQAVANAAENETLQLFAAGEAAFMRNWPYAWREIENGGGPVAGHVGVSPVLAAPGQQTGGTLGTWGFSLIAGSPHPSEAAEVIRWLTAPDTQRQLVMAQGYAPTWSALYDDPELARLQPLLAVQRRALEEALVRPLTPLYAQLSDLLQRQVNGLISGGGSAPAAMAEAQRRSSVLLDAASTS